MFREVQKALYSSVVLDFTPRPDPSELAPVGQIIAEDLPSLSIPCMRGRHVVWEPRQILQRRW